MFTLRTCADATAQAEALADAVCAALAATLATRGPSARATLAVSGGTSPKLFFQMLATRPLDWSRIDVTLVDERWVAEDDEASNARLVRATLLKQAAAQARFLPLADLARTPAEQVAALNRAALPALADVAVLGMGENGHSASLFVDAPEWHESITTEARFVLVHPASVPQARISWSLTAIRSFGKLFLQIGGPAKLAVFQQAAAQPVENAISKILHSPGSVLDVYSFP